VDRVLQQPRLASAVSIVLVLLLVAPIMWFQHLQSREQEGAR
jgi:ABC-type spermidine/putrescine transport system permease subunit I